MNSKLISTILIFAQTNTLYNLNPKAWNTKLFSFQYFKHPVYRIFGFSFLYIAEILRILREVTDGSLSPSTSIDRARLLYPHPWRFGLLNSNPSPHYTLRIGRRFPPLPYLIMFMSTDVVHAVYGSSS